MGSKKELKSSRGGGKLECRKGGKNVFQSRILKRLVERGARGKKRTGVEGRSEWQVIRKKQSEKTRRRKKVVCRYPVE